ncbi:hypothetical protein GCM10018953_46710 [Streptosporangium nondiastaticum]
MGNAAVPFRTVDRIEVGAQKFGARRVQRDGGGLAGVADERGHTPAACGEQVTGDGAALLSGGFGDQDGSGVRHDRLPGRGGKGGSMESLAYARCLLPRRLR